MNIRRSVLMAIAAVSVVAITTMAQPTHVDGIGVITRSYLFDLDTGAAAISGGDFWYHHDQGLPDELAPFDPLEPHSATMRRMGALRPTYHDCATAPLTMKPVAFSKLPNGTWICFRTNRGRVARIKVLHQPVKGDRRFRFAYLTWTK